MRRPHPDVHIVAGCVVAGTADDGRKMVERVGDDEVPSFWGHYRVGPDGRQEWLADFGDPDAAMAAAQISAGRAQVILHGVGTAASAVSGSGGRSHRQPKP